MIYFSVDSEFVVGLYDVRVLQNLGFEQNTMQVVKLYLCIYNRLDSNILSYVDFPACPISAPNCSIVSKHQLTRIFLIIFNTLSAFTKT